MIHRAIYQLVFKRSSTFTLAMVISAMFFERAADHFCESIFEKHNEGVTNNFITYENHFFQINFI